MFCFIVSLYQAPESLLKNIDLTSPGYPCAPKRKLLAGCNRSLASSHQARGWLCTLGYQYEALACGDLHLPSQAPQPSLKCQMSNFTSQQMYLPPSEVTTSLHWHWSTSTLTLTTSLNLVWDFWPASGRCSSCSCGDCCICCCCCCCDDPRRVSPRRLSGLLAPLVSSCLLWPPPRLAWKGWLNIGAMDDLEWVT